MIPVNVITGYLGAGKTTLLQKILEKKNIAIVLNEFGEIGIDGKIIRGKNIDLIELSGGCVCCSLSGDFEDAVKELEERNPERIVIETTGVAEADSVVDGIGKIDGVYLDSVIAVADAHSLTEFPSLSRTGASQIELADVIILNKSDLVEDTSAARKKLEKINSRARIIEATFCDVDPDDLFGFKAEKRTRKERHRTVEKSYTVKNQEFDYDEFIKFLETTRVFRIKGTVRTNKGSYFINFVNGKYDISDSGDAETELVLIESGFDYRFRDDVSIADVAFEAQGETLEDLFVNCAKALTNSMVEDISAIECRTKIQVDLESENTEKLLHNFLDDIIFHKDADLLIFSGFDISIDGNRLKGTLCGEQIDTGKHRMIVDVKAVSWHMYKVEKKQRWEAFVILDV